MLSAVHAKGSKIHIVLATIHTMSYRKGSRQSHCAAVLLLLLAGLQLLLAQDQACIDALNAADRDNDKLINRAEYINALVDLSPYKGCPDLGQIGDFLKLGLFSLTFEGLSCLCQRYNSSDPNCCSGKVKGIATPGVYPESYTIRVCETLNDTLVSECTPEPTEAPKPVPPSEIVEATDAPSSAPSSPGVRQKKGLTSDEQDDKNTAKIVVPIVLGIFVFVLSILLMVSRHQEEGGFDHASRKISKTSTNDTMKQGLEECDPTEDSDDAPIDVP